MKSLVLSDAKNEQDVRLIVAKIHAIQYGKDSRFGADHFFAVMYCTPDHRYRPVGMDSDI